VRSRNGYVRCSIKIVLRGMQAYFSKVCSEMSNAKTGWMRAEAAGDPGPWRQQAILGRRDWDADGLRDIVRDYVIEHWRMTMQSW
jgi:SRSO17 transposase